MIAAHTVYVPQLPEVLQALILMYSLFSSDERRGQVSMWDSMVLCISQGFVALHAAECSQPCLR